MLKQQSVLLIFLICPFLFGNSVKFSPTVMDSREIRVISLSDSAQLYRSDLHENILHLAVVSGDISLIHEIDSLYPLLKKAKAKNGLNPIQLAAHEGDTSIIDLLDPTFEFITRSTQRRDQPSYSHSRNHYPLYPTLCHWAVQSNDTTDEITFSYIFNKMANDSTGVFEEWNSYFDTLKNVISLHKNLVRMERNIARDALISYCNMKSNSIKSQWLSNASQQYARGGQLFFHNDRIEFVQLITPPPSEFLFQPLVRAIKTSNKPLIEIYLSNGGYTSEMSVFNSEVHSLLTLAKEVGDTAVINMIAQCQISERWFELQIPDFYPTFTGRTDSNWVAVHTIDQFTETSRGAIPDELLTVQTEEYLTQYHDHYLFAVRSSEFIDTVHTSYYGTNCLQHGDSLRIVLPEITNPELVDNEESYKTYTFTIESDSNHYRVTLKNESVEQQFSILHHFRNEEAGVQILWAGDLDGDLQLDFIISTNRADNQYHEYRLAVSSLAIEGELFGWADECYLFGSYIKFSDNNNYYSEYEGKFPGNKMMR